MNFGSSKEKVLMANKIQILLLLLLYAMQPAPLHPQDKGRQGIGCYYSTIRSIDL